MQYELDWNGSFESERTRRAIGSTTSLAGCGSRLYWASELSMYCELCTSSLRNLAAASLGDTQLRRAVAGLRLPRPQAEITAHRPALGKAVGIFQGEHVGQRDQRPNALHLLQQSGLPDTVPQPARVSCGRSS